MTTKIEWTGRTWNPVVGCSPISAGCDNCYAARFAARGMCQGHVGLSDGRKFTGKIRLLPNRLEEPLRWSTPQMVFVCSMGDLFHEKVPFEFIDKVFAVMALRPQHTFQLLSKRPERVAEYLDAASLHNRLELAADKLNPGKGCSAFGGKHMLPKLPFPNVWFGTSVEDQAAADERLPHLLRCPAAVRFVSCEPLLGPVDLPLITDEGLDMPPHERELAGLPETAIAIGGVKLDWIIAGGESGPGARPMHPDWARGLRDQAAAAGVPFFFKQWGEWLPALQDGADEAGAKILNCSDNAERVGKKAAGRMLDGREHSAMPACLTAEAAENAVG